MSVVSYIEHLRTKPEHVRRRIAFWSSLSVTGLILMFWVASYTTVGPRASSAIAETVDRVQTPAQSLTANVGAFFGDVRDMFWKPKRVEYGTIEVVPGKR